MGPFRLITFYLWGFAQVFAQAAALSLLTLWTIQWGAIAVAAPRFDPNPIYIHLFVSFSFALFFPGQTFWTHTRKGPDGKTYVIVGAQDGQQP